MHVVLHFPEKKQIFTLLLPVDVYSDDVWLLLGTFLSTFLYSQQLNNDIYYLCCSSKLFHH